MTQSYLVIALSLFVLILVFAGSGWFVYTWQQERRALSGLQFSYESASQRSAYESSVRALFRDIADERVRLAGIAENNDPVEIIRLLENAGNAAGISIAVNSVNSGSPHPEDLSLSSFIIALETSGAFGDLYHFVSLMETFPLPSSIEQMQLEREENGWKLEMIIRIFIEETV